MKMKSLSPASRMNSIGFACKGIIKFFRQEPNAWIHLFSTALLFVAVMYFKIQGSQLIALVIVTGLVWVAEAFNTAVERIMDFISPEYHPKVEFIKDLSAGAVLMAAGTALVTATIVFIPKLF